MCQYQNVYLQTWKTQEQRSKQASRMFHFCVSKIKTKFYKKQLLKTKKSTKQWKTSKSDQWIPKVKIKKNKRQLVNTIRQDILLTYNNLLSQSYTNTLRFTFKPHLLLSLYCCFAASQFHKIFFSPFLYFFAASVFK